MRLIVVDPRRTESAAFADLWLGIDVGTDIALSNTIAREIIANDLQHRAFIERATENFDEYAESVAMDWTLERGEEVTGRPGRGDPRGRARVREGRPRDDLLDARHHRAPQRRRQRPGADQPRAPDRSRRQLRQRPEPAPRAEQRPGRRRHGRDPEQAPRVPGHRPTIRTARARSRRRGAGRSCRGTGWHLTEMFQAMERGELTAALLIGENPASSEADSQHATKLLENLDTLIVQDIFMTQTAEIADVVFPASNAAFESEGTVTNSERRVQRVRKALDPPGDAKDDIWIIARARESASGYDWGDLTAHEAWEELRSLSPMHAACRGSDSRSWAASSGPAPTSRTRGRSSCMRGCGIRRPRGAGDGGAVQRGGRRAAGRRADRRVPDPADDRATAGLLQHRCADGRLHVAAPAAGGASSSRRRMPTRSALAEGERVRVSSRRGEVEAPVHISLGPPAGSRVHDAALPGRGRDEPAHDRSDGPEVRHGGVQGDGDPRSTSCRGDAAPSSRGAV